MEEIIKKNLFFLCSTHKMKYSCYTFENYLGTNFTLDTYNFYNENGCFSILNIEQRGDLNFACFEGIEFLKKYIEITFKCRHVYKIDVETKESSIWRKHQKIGMIKNPFFWWSKKRIFRALGEVIETQISKNGEFYGIKV